MDTLQRKVRKFARNHSNKSTLEESVSSETVDVHDPVSEETEQTENGHWSADPDFSMPTVFEFVGKTVQWEHEFAEIRTMGFGTDFQGKASHEALLRLQDNEIRLLDNIKRCLTVRIDSDKKYAASLSSIVQQAQKLEVPEFKDHCPVFQAWDTIIVQTDRFVKLLKQNVEEMASKTFDRLNDLINEKKTARRQYLEERNKLDQDFTKVQEDVHKHKQEYGKCLTRVSQDQAKYNDAKNKGKTGAKLEEVKTKVHRSTGKLHRVHNDYVLSLKEAMTHQTCYLTQTLPTFLDSHQSKQESLIHQCKDVLSEYHRLINFSNEDCRSVFDTMEESVQNIVPEKEYTDKYLTEFKTDPLESTKFEFDAGLLNDYKGTLQESKLVVDELTQENLTVRHASLEDELSALKKTLQDKENEVKDIETKVRDLKLAANGQSKDNSKSELSLKTKEQDRQKFELSVIKAKIATAEELSCAIKKELDATGSDIPVAVDVSLTSTSPPDTPDVTSPTSSSRLKIGFNKLTKLARPKTQVSEVKEEKTDRGGSYEDQQLPESPSHSASNGPSSENSSELPQPVEPTVPLEEEEWFHGVLPREEVQRLLVNDGDFIVRESKNRKTNETQYVLSVNWQGYKHFIIQYGDGGWRFEGPSFPTIHELVMHQYQSGLEVTNKSKAILKKAILREQWQLKNDDIALEMKIGNGNFGEVYRGIYKANNQVVAVKTCRDTLSEDQRKKFLMEGRILKQYNHPNIVRFIGIAAQRQPVMIVMEYVAGGALLNFLRKHGKTQSKKQLTQMCENAASGMAYLEEKQCIHRDLAARNCLVGDKNVVKISDFGMSREEEEYTVSEGLKQIPIKWTAPEALMYGKYTSMCDVWSFGILMWEVFSGGMTPYSGMSNNQAREKVDTGYRMPAPEGTPDAVHKLMLKTWEYNPSSRPHFKDLQSELHAIVPKL